MKNKILFLFLLTATFTMSCDENFLEKGPLDTESASSFWTSEQNVRTFSYGFYTYFFEGYGSGFTWPKYTFLVQSLNDDCGPVTPTSYNKTVPAAASLAVPTNISNNTWNFSFVRRANDFIANIPKVAMNDEAKNHWMGVARFFRAMEYANLVNKYGDVPWIDQVLTETDTVLMYRPRDPRTFVMDKVLEDFQFAVANVRANDGNKGLVVDKYVVLAFMSRVFLFEGTFLKYHANDPAKSTAYLEASKWASNELMNSNVFSVADDYRSMFNSMDLAGNKEVIMYRSYVSGVITHSVNSYVNRESQTGVNKNAIESYLGSDGLPIGISAVYQGDKTAANVFANRDPRMYATIAQEFRVDGHYKGLYNFSTTGYSLLKFLNEAIQGQTEGGSSLNPTDGPVIRFGEILLNYAEACTELGTLTQEDLDKSINKLRARKIPVGSTVKAAMPALQIIGGLPAVNGITYDDPKRDATVPAMLWEIRRERRIELMAEGFRLDDLRRWKKLEYTDTKANVDINRGAYIVKTEYPGAKPVLTGGTEGYIIPSTAAASAREFIAPANPRVYLAPLPLDQIKLFSDRGITLTQNPGW